MLVYTAYVVVYLYVLHAHIHGIHNMIAHMHTHTHTHTTDDIEYFSAERKCPNEDFGVDMCDDHKSWNIYTNVTI